MPATNLILPGSPRYLRYKLCIILLFCSFFCCFCCIICCCIVCCFCVSIICCCFCICSKGINCSFCMLYIQIFYCFDSSKSFDLAVNAVKSIRMLRTGLFQESSSSPAISLFAWSPATTISGRRTTFLISCFFYFFDNSLACCIFRLTFYSTDE